MMDGSCGEEREREQDDKGESRQEQRAGQEARGWSDKEWEEWNVWHSGWNSWRWNRDGWNSWHGSGDSQGGEVQQVAGDGPGYHRASNAAWERSASWGDGWWQQSKGDYADPPPWGGWPNYRLWKRAVQRWNANTDVAMWRRAEKLLKSFDWELQSKLDHLDEGVLSGPAYLDSVLRVLDVLAGEKETSDKRRHVRAALYEGHRQSGEGLAQYALRREAQVSNAEKYLRIPDDLKGFMMEEQSGLSKQGLQNLRTLTGGSSDYSSVQRALRLLNTEEESMVKSGAKTQSFYNWPERGDSEDSSGDEIVDQNLLTIQEKDMDEDEALVFLSRSWLENRQLKAARKKDRRHFDEKDEGAPRPAGRKRLSIDELKKVTRCANCGEKGHWREECTRPYRAKSGEARSSSSGKTKTQASAFSYFGQPPSSSGTSLFIFAETFLENFLQVPAGHTVIDPGASQDLIGYEAFQKLTKRLEEQGLRPVVLSEKPPPASGIGGKAEPMFNALSPIFLGGRPGVIKLTVLRENIPHLLSIGLLEFVRAVIDTGTNKISFGAFDSSSPMLRLESGHRLLDVASCGKCEFHIPDEVVREYGLSVGDFQCSPDSEPCQAYMGGSTGPGEGLVSSHVFREHFEGILDGGLGVREDHLGSLCLIEKCQGCLRACPNLPHKDSHKFRSTWVLDGKQLFCLESCVVWEAFARTTASFSRDSGLGGQVQITLFSELSSHAFYSVFPKVLEVSLRFTSESWHVSSGASACDARLKPSCSSPKSHVHAATARDGAEVGANGPEAADGVVPGGQRLVEAQPIGSAGLSECGRGLPASPRLGGAGRQPVWDMGSLCPLQEEAVVRGILSNQPTAEVKAVQRISRDLCSSSEGPGKHEERQRQAGPRSDQPAAPRESPGAAGGLYGPRDHGGDRLGAEPRAAGSAGAAAHAPDGDGECRAAAAAAAVSHSSSTAPRESSALPDVTPRGGPGHAESQPDWLGARAVMSLASWAGLHEVSLPDELTKESSWLVAELANPVVHSRGILSFDSCITFYVDHCSHGQVSLVFWCDPQLCASLVLSDASDDHEFQVPRRVKRLISSTVESLQEASPEHFAHNPVSLAREAGQMSFRTTQEQEPASEEDARTSDPVKPSEEAEAQRGEDARTSRAIDDRHDEAVGSDSPEGRQKVSLEQGLTASFPGAVFHTSPWRLSARHGRADQQSHKIPSYPAFPVVESSDDEHSEEALDHEQQVEPQAPQELSSEDRERVRRVHVNMGHLPKDKMLALLKAAGARPEVMRYVKDTFQCGHCMKRQHPVPRRKAAIPRTFSFNRVVGVDIFYVAWCGETLAFLNVVCHGTNLQQVCRIIGYKGGTPFSMEVWKAFNELWIRPFGLPESIITDGGLEFRHDFERAMEQAGVLQITTDAQSPWQNGRAERHGGWVKEKLESELQSGQALPQTKEEFDLLVTSLVSHKNRWFHRGGYSPYQLTFGCNPRIPMELLSDDGLTVPGMCEVLADSFEQDTAAAAFNRAHLIRQRARELCVQNTAKDRYKLASQQRPHVQQDWFPGQWVFVWRRFPGTGAGHVVRSRWTGPGLVALQQGHTVWVSMRSRLLKCNSDQLRQANHKEAVGAELQRSGEIRDLLLQSKAHRAGAVDVSKEGTPPQEAWDTGVPLEPAIAIDHSQGQALDAIPEEEAMPGRMPGMPLLRDLRPLSPVEGSEPGTSLREDQQPLQASRQLSSQTVEEPLGEPQPAATASETTSTAHESGKRKQMIPAPKTPAGHRVRRQVEDFEERIIARELRRIEREERAASRTPQRQRSTVHGRYSHTHGLAPQC